MERRGDVPDPLARTAAGRSLRTTWTVTPPEGAPTGSYDLILRTSYRSPSGFRVDNALPLDRDRGGAATLGDVRLGDLAPAQPLTADVTGAQVARLVATDGSDGITSDRGDWAEARLSC